MSAVVAGFCMKKRYSSYDFALKVAKKCEQKREVKLYIYLCPNPGCMGYHLSKQARHEGRVV